MVLAIGFEVTRVKGQGVLVAQHGSDSLVDAGELSLEAGEVGPAAGLLGQVAHLGLGDVQVHASNAGAVSVGLKAVVVKLYEPGHPDSIDGGAVLAGDLANLAPGKLAESIQAGADEHDGSLALDILQPVQGIGQGVVHVGLAEAAAVLQ